MSVKQLSTFFVTPLSSVPNGVPKYRRGHILFEFCLRVADIIGSSLDVVRCRGTHIRVTANPLDYQGTLGGNFGVANWISDSGEIVGTANYAGDQVQHAFHWKNGIKTDLGTLPGDPCSFSQAINSKGQIVGESEPVCFTPQQARAFLWENGGPMVDLNTLVSSRSGVQLISAVDINDRGEIVGSDALPNGDSHAILLIPCDEHHPGIEGCDYSLVDASATVDDRPTPRQRPTTANP